MREIAHIISFRLGEMIKAVLQGFGLACGFIAAWMIWNAAAQWVFA